MTRDENTNMPTIRWPERDDITLDHPKMVALLDAVVSPDVRPLAGFATFAGEAVVYLVEPHTLRVSGQYTVTGECLAVLTDRLCELGHAAGPEFATVLSRLRKSDD